LPILFLKAPVNSHWPTWRRASGNRDQLWIKTMTW
jgi:hypothetical protein